MTSNLDSASRLKWYERILNLSQRATKESIESVCQFLMDDAISAASAERGILLLADEKGKMRVAIARYDTRENVLKDQQNYSDTIVKRAIEMEAPLILDDAMTHPDFAQAKSVITNQLRSVLVLPLFFDKKCIGVIYLENRNQAAFFAPELLEFLTLFATHGAIVLHAKLLQSPSEAPSTPSQTGVRSKNSKMQEILKQAEQAARTESSILILGETGTGKEVLARHIHTMSNRARNGFVAINCSAIPETLIESELFGYKKGAFTGAMADRAGLVKKAHNGTLFLDEIGDLPLHMQAKILRVLQEKTFMPVGSTVEERSEFRLIAATHKPLEEAVVQGFFRQDLFFRINTLTFKLPPLRQRSEDLLEIAADFVRHAAREHGKRFTGIDESAASVLLQHEWPGNIRQLQNAIQRAMVLTQETPGKSVLSGQDFDFLNESPKASALPSLSEAKDNFIRNYVKKAILIHKGNKTKAAKALGVDPKTLYRHLAGEDED